MPIDGQMVQIAFYFGGAQVPRVAFPVKENELANPEPVSFLGPGAEMAAPANGGYLIEQARGDCRVVTP